MSRQLKGCEARLHNSIDQALNLINTLDDLGYLSTASTVSRHEKDALLSYYLIRFFIAWEDFLEESISRYMCGYSGLSGRQIIPINGTHNKISSAHTSLLTGQAFLSWSIGQAKTRSISVFGARNIIDLTLTNYYSDLDSINRIRNASAHRSANARTRFEQLVLSELGYLPRGITPGKFLRTNHPVNGIQYSVYYGRIIKLLGTLIATN